MKKNNGFLVLILAILGGYIAGVLSSPKNGDEMRKEWGDRAKKWKEDLSSQIEDKKGMVQDKVEEMKKVTEEKKNEAKQKDVFESIRDAIDDAEKNLRSKIEKAGDEAEK